MPQPADALKTLCEDGRAEWLAKEFAAEPHGTPISDAAYFRSMVEICTEQGDFVSAEMFRGKLKAVERESLLEHTRWCEGCLGCRPESNERGTDI